jgi:hypothetical protein
MVHVFWNTHDDAVPPPGATANHVRQEEELPLDSSAWKALLGETRFELSLSTRST